MRGAGVLGPFGVERRRRKPVINITSLIDVMFILLIFLMVTTTFRKHVGIDVSLPSAENAVQQEASPHEIVVTKEGEFFLGDRPVDAEELKMALGDLLKAEPEASLVLRADEQADFGAVVRAIDIARAIGGSRLVIPTRPEPARTPPAQ